jgi:DNA polymerase (family 10)
VPDPSNAAIADALEELGDLYELDGAIAYRVLAYRTAAKAVREASVPVATLAREGRATELPGIGNTLQEKVLALATTGTIRGAGDRRGTRRRPARASRGSWRASSGGWWWRRCRCP